MRPRRGAVGAVGEQTLKLALMARQPCDGTATPARSIRFSVIAVRPNKEGLDADRYVFYIRHMTHFGDTVREIRERRRGDDRRYSLRQVAGRVGIEPAYLSKIERGDVAPPSEATTRRLAEELDQDPDVFLALAGKVSRDLQDIIRRRPELFAELIRQLKDAPDSAILRVVREVRDGEW